MKKVLIANDVKNRYLEKNSVLDRTGISVFTAATNDDMLKIHSAEKVNLIVTKLDMPGLRTEDLFDNIRNEKNLRDVSTVVICENSVVHQERCRLCGANAVFTMPVDADLLHAKVQQLLDVAPRQAYRVALNVAVEGKFKNRPFLYRTENISATGLLMKAEGIFERGDRMSFSFFLPDGTRISAHGEIERVVKQTTDVYLYGIKFTDITSSLKWAINIFVKKQLENKRSLDSHPDTR